MKNSPTESFPMCKVDELQGLLYTRTDFLPK